VAEGMRLWFLPDPGDFSEDDLQLLAVGIVEYSEVVPITPDRPYVVSGGGGGVSRWGNRHYPDKQQQIIDDNEIMELLANILPIIIG